MLLVSRDFLDFLLTSSMKVIFTIVNQWQLVCQLLGRREGREHSGFGLAGSRWAL